MSRTKGRKKKTTDPNQPRVMFVKTPKKGKEKESFKIPKVKISKEEEIEGDVDSLDLLVFLQRLLSAINEMWSVILGVGRDIETSFDLMCGDISRLHIQGESVHARIGDQGDLEQEFVGSNPRNSEGIRPG